MACFSPCRFAPVTQLKPCPYVHLKTLIEPTELRYWDKTTAYNGYTLFAAHGTTYLIDMEGYVVHTWRMGTNPRLLAYNGHLLDATKDDPSGFQGFRELDWDGNTVWEHLENRTDYAPHHDWVRIFNEVLPDHYPMANAVFRAYRYGADHPALAGRDLTPGKTITGKAPSYLTPDGTAAGTDPPVPPTNAPPKIAGTTHTPNAPTSTDPVWVRTTVTDDGSVAVTLTYSDGSSGGSGEQTVFQETMGKTAVKPWTGDGCDNAWTVTARTPENVEQRTQANQGSGNPCGLEFGRGTNDEADTMVETAQGIDARGNAGYVAFWMWADGLEGTDGWTFQVNSGNGYVTRLSELTGSNHEWQDYRYDLQADELVDGLKLRFQFRGGDQGDRIRLDLVSVRMASANGATGGGNTNVGGNRVTVAMYDDGAHTDGVLGDGVYGAEIPAFPAGATVTYSITATDAQGAKITDPAGAPGTTHFYTVRTADTGTSAWTMRKLPDTGQMGDHTAAPGEDSDYTINPPSYTDNGDGTVTDNVTGLMWQQTDGGEMTWEQAQAYAGGLSLGGHDDWRLPISHELFSLVDLNAVNPAMNTTYFPNAQAARYWSSTTQVNAASRAWTVDFGYGLVSYDEKTGQWSVRCVRGGGRAQTQIPDFVRVPAGTFEMGDHHDLGGLEHSSDEVPVHTVSAEWEYAARGGQYTPYRIFPWGDDENKAGTFANWPRSGDPYETGPLPWTTPAGFYNGEAHQKADFDWPGSQDSYQTSDGSSAYGLYDMSGNVWEWCNDWYNRNYYSSAPADNPTGPESGSPMPDGNPYHVLRGGNWFNGEQYWGHARTANRTRAPT